MNSNQNQLPQDPWLYSGLFHSLGTERLSFQAITGDFSRLFKTLANLGQKHKLAQDRLEQLQQQVNKIETNIRESNMPTAGTRFDKIR